MNFGRGGGVIVFVFVFDCKYAAMQGIAMEVANSKKQSRRSLRLLSCGFKPPGAERGAGNRNRNRNRNRGVGHLGAIW